MLLLNSRGGGAPENNAPVGFEVVKPFDCLVGKFRFLWCFFGTEERNNLLDSGCFLSVGGHRHCENFSMHKGRHCERKRTHEHPVPYGSETLPTVQASNRAYVYNYINENSSTCAILETTNWLDCFAAARNDGTVINRSRGNNNNVTNLLRLGLFVTPPRYAGSGQPLHFASFCSRKLAASAGCCTFGLGSLNAHRRPFENPLFTSSKKSSFTPQKHLPSQKGATHVETSAKKCAHAFTLAEVLITLAIIGIVAAMTLPTVIKNSRNRELESRFKTAYSLVSQAVLRMTVDEPEITTRYCGTQSDHRFDMKQNIFILDFAKYFQTVSVNQNLKGDMDLTKIGYPGIRFRQPVYGKDANFNPDSHNNGHIVLKNGMIIFSSGCWWADGNNMPVDFVVDTNGFKGPNKLGYDVFYFQIVDRNILMPSNSKNSFVVQNSQSEDCCNFEEEGTCRPASDNGAACAFFALQDTYPQDKSKSYWKNLP